MESSHACSFCLGSEIVEWWVAVAQLAEEHVFSHHWIRMINSVFPEYECAACFNGSY